MHAYNTFAPIYQENEIEEWLRQP